MWKKIKEILASKMLRKIVLALIVLAIGLGIGFFVYKTEPRLNKNFEAQKVFFKKFPFRLGLDLSGGSHLVYKADVSAVPSNQVGDSMDALRDIIERRVNLFGVSEPVVQVQHGSVISGAGEQLIVDLPGITESYRDDRANTTSRIQNRTTKRSTDHYQWL